MGAFLSVVDRVKELKLGYVFKLKNKSCPIYLREKFSKLDENTHGRETRSKAYNFQVPRVNTNNFSYSAIKDWSSLSNPIKDIKSEQSFKEHVKKFLRSAAKDLETCEFIYF